jgi:transposase, IS5 family
MKQISLVGTGFEVSTKRTRKREFLEEMNRVVPWAQLVALIAPHAPSAKTGRPPFAVETMLRIHFLQQWFNLSDPGMEEALYDMPLFQQFAGLDVGADRLPDESTILRFRHLLERHELATQILATVNSVLAQQGLLLKEGTVVDATLIAAPSSTKNQEGKRDPEMHQTKKGNQWHFGMKAHIGVDADSGLVHTVVGTAANVNDVTQAHALVHGKESDVFADAGYQGVEKRDDTQKIKACWHVALRPGLRRQLDSNVAKDALIERLEHVKASIRAKVEHPFRVIKLQFGHVKARYRGLKKNTAQLYTLFALANVWMARRRMKPAG